MRRKTVGPGVDSAFSDQECAVTHVVGEVLAFDLEFKNVGGSVILG